MNRRIRRALMAATALATIAAAAFGIAPAATASATGSASATPQLIGGVPATQRYDWITALKRNYKGNHQQFCTAVLLAPQWVVINAHCVTDQTGAGIDPVTNDVFVRIGSNDSEHGGILDNVVRIIPEPQWDWLTVDSKGRVDDIALLHLKDYVSNQPVLIASHDPKVGTMVRQLGWGRTDPSNTGPLPEHLQQVDTTFAGVYQAAAPCNTNPEALLGVDENCANAADGFRGGCGGDSGGPELEKINGRWEDIGGLSSSPGLLPGCGGEADQYVDLTYFAPWLYAVMRGQDPQQAEDYLPGGQATPVSHAMRARAPHDTAMQAFYSLAG